MYNPTKQIKEAVEYINAIKKESKMKLTKSEVVKGLENLMENHYGGNLAELFSAAISYLQQEPKDKLLDILYAYCGETGYTENAETTLLRLEDELLAYRRKAQQEPIGREELRTILIDLYVNGNHDGFDKRNWGKLSSKCRDIVDQAMNKIALIPQQEMMSEPEILKAIKDNLDWQYDFVKVDEKHIWDLRLLAHALSHIPAGKEERKIENALCKTCRVKCDSAYIKGFFKTCNLYEPLPEKTYPCSMCGKLRTKAEGGTTFTICDECWDKTHLLEL